MGVDKSVHLVIYNDHNSPLKFTAFSTYFDAYKFIKAMKKTFPDLLVSCQEVDYFE